LEILNISVKTTKPSHRALAFSQVLFLYPKEVTAEFYSFVLAGSIFADDAEANRGSGAGDRPACGGGKMGGSKGEKWKKIIDRISRIMYNKVNLFGLYRE
jgi:hypothetical protein